MYKNSAVSKALLLFVKNGGYVQNNVVYKKGAVYDKVHICNGYYTIYIYDGIRHGVGVKLHLIVAYQKYGNKIFNKGNNLIHVRHLDNNRLNNLEDNIALGTPSENMMDIPRERRIKSAIYAASKNRRFTDEEVKAIVTDRYNGYTYRQLCKKYDTSKSTLSYLFNYAYYTNRQTEMV
jgi:hypothetical protein